MAGLIIGLIIWALPAHIFFSKEERIPLNTFVAEYPDKSSLARLLFSLIGIWFFVWLVIVGVTFWAFDDFNPNSMLFRAAFYLCNFSLGGGTVLIEAFIEIRTCTTVVHYLTGSQTGTPKYVIHGPKVRRFGMIRLLLVFMCGIVPLPFL